MDYKRILLVRTDRIGDVLLTTPAIEAVRKKFPSAHIAVMIRPYAEDIVDGNPYIDEVIIYDKYGRHKSIWASYCFAKELKKKNFDVAVILHPTNRAHIVTYLAGIPKRIGYGRNFSVLLTDKIHHEKQLGRMHEVDYAIQILRPLGITEAEKRNLCMPIKTESEKSIDALFITEGIGSGERIAVIHPGASCDSKVWPAERFAEVADRLIDKYGIKAVIVGSDEKRDMKCAESMINHMFSKAASLAGKLSISELAPCLKKAAVFITNDSGPVHIACAVGTPAVVIFGRRQPGLNPRRWGPTGKGDIVLHKDVGCGDNCLAHNCQKGSACLNAVTADEVYEAAVKLLQLT